MNKNVFHRLWQNKQLKRIFSAILLCILFVAFIFPFYWMVATSLKETLEAVQYPPTFFPRTFKISNYAEAFQEANFLRYGMNSIIVTFVTVFFHVLICVPAAYAFARMDFRGKKIMDALIKVDMMVPPQTIFIPVYLVFSKLGWLDTYQALILPFVYSAFSIFFMTGSFKQVSGEIIEAARLDGGSEASIMFRIVLPMQKAVVVTMGLLCFIKRWNDYFWCLVLTNKDTVRTLPFAVKALTAAKDGFVTRWDLGMAGNVMLVLPLLVLYVFANKKIKSAFAYNGIK